MVAKPSGHKNKHLLGIAKMTREAFSATFHGWKDVDLIVRSNEIEVDEDDLNEGFCHY